MPHTSCYFIIVGLLFFLLFFLLLLLSMVISCSKVKLYKLQSKVGFYLNESD